MCRGRALYSGFTLAELLIALAILGVIATFSIPKLLQAQADQRRLAAAKEVAGSLSEALLLYKTQVGLTAGVSKASDLFQYMNYLKLDTTSSVDNYPLFAGTSTCEVNYPCIRLFNGGLLKVSDPTWSGTASTNAISFVFDADGTVTGLNDSVNLSLYADGAVRSRRYLKANTEYDTGVFRGPEPTGDPAWFSW